MEVIASSLTVSFAFNMFNLQNTLDVPMGRQRSKSESGGGGGARHFADFSLFPDRYDSGGMNRSSTMNEGFNRGKLSRLSSMPEEPKRPTDSNFHKKPQVCE